MLPRNHPDRIQFAFHDQRLVANAGLILPATLALRLGLPQLLRKHLDLGGAPGRANTGDKTMTLVASALASGDRIDDADVLRAGGTARVLGFTAKAPSTLGTFLRSFRWGHIRQLDWVSRELLARVWKAGAGPGDAPFTINLDFDDLRDLRTGQEGPGAWPGERVSREPDTWAPPPTWFFALSTTARVSCASPGRSGSSKVSMCGSDEVRCNPMVALPPLMDTTTFRSSG